MTTRRAGRSAAAAGVLLVLSACGALADEGADVVDGLAERGVAAYAEGRWRCETDANDSGSREHLTTIVAVGADGRFSYEVPQDFQPALAGTWSVEGLELRIEVPWIGDGRTGFYPWLYTADADPPTRVTGRRLDSSPDSQELEVEFDDDRLRIVQRDEPGLDGPNYDWAVHCERESRDPGAIPPTMPASDGYED
ncbi:MAG TPA: hypothetical protein VHK88_02865 [Aquihabitans sp.]|jgi:hypothetical protein|nr:hypothetical protein [Aquihabitans sp.]